MSWDDGIAQYYVPKKESMSEQTKRPDIMKYFKFEHIGNSDAREMSQRFCVLAEAVLVNSLPSAEQSACLRKLLEAKDCAVRAVLP